MQLGGNYCYLQARECAARGIIEQGKSDELAKISHWNRLEIETFFKKHNLPENDLKEPLLPAIARYYYWEMQAKIAFSRYKENYNNQVNNRVLRLEGRREGWRILEEQAIPCALNAAFMLKVISQPTLQIEWHEMGRCFKKPFDERLFDQILDNNDDYFKFNNPSQLPLTFKGIYEKLEHFDINALQSMLFPSQALRACLKSSIG